MFDSDLDTARNTKTVSLVETVTWIGTTNFNQIFTKIVTNQIKGRQIERIQKAEYKS